MDIAIVQNYRGISLIPAAVKIYKKMLLNRLKPHIGYILHSNQNGFREGRSSVTQILALRRRRIEEVKTSNISAALNFIDFRKVFDSVSIECLFLNLVEYGIPTSIITAINKVSLYRHNCTSSHRGQQ